MRIVHQENPLAEPPAELLPLARSGALQTAAQAADQAAARYVFADYRQRLAARTRDAQDNDLARFVHYMRSVNVTLTAEQLASKTQAWSGMSWGIVAGFVQWQLSQGYAVSSINRALSTVKVYAKLAAQAGALPPESLALIKTVAGYGPKQGRRVDAARPVARVGAKKAAPVRITLEQARQLKDQPRDTPQGRRDALLMCLLLDLGLRVGEVAALEVSAIDMTAGVLTFYREKVDKAQQHKLTADVLRAAAAYLAADAPVSGRLLRGSRKDGALAGGMSIRAIQLRVQRLGATVAIDALSPHDLRHYWATNATRSGTHPFALQEAGGWTSLDMPRRYTEAAIIANADVKLEF